MKRRFWGPGFLIALNLFLIWPWLGEGYAPFGASFEPAVIARGRFIRDNWPNIGWNPEWYLGFPNRLSGSLALPFLMAGLGLGGLSLELVYRLVTGLGIVLMPLGVYLLGKEWGGKKGEEVGLGAGLIFSLAPGVVFLFPQVFEVGRKIGFSPWQFFSLAYLGNGLKIWGLAAVPFCLLVIDRWLRKKGSFRSAVFLVSLLALVDLSSVLTLVILVVLLLISEAMRGRLKDKIRRAGEVFGLSFLLLGFGYTPRFWYQVLMAPSLAGKRAIDVGFFLGRVFSILVPMLLAGFSAKFLRKKKERLVLMSFLWVLVFGFLTLSRFLADYDFWQDYTAWGVELGMGAALLLGMVLVRGESFRRWGILGGVVLMSFLWVEKRGVLLTPRKEIGGTVEGRVVEKLKDLVGPGERVYLSGSVVFWLNSLTEIGQVRGGADGVATHPFWAQASYQIRVGDNPELAEEWLKALGVSWMVVHEEDSEEPYHDFIYPEKFGGWKRVWGEKGDVIYKLKGGVGREVENSEEFLELKPPRGGADLAGVRQYNSFLGKDLGVGWLSPEEIVLRAEEGAVSLAISYDFGWQAWQGGRRLKKEKDALGQMVIFPQGGGEVRLKYRGVFWDQLAGLFLTGMGLFWFKKRLFWGRVK